MKNAKKFFLIAMIASLLFNDGLLSPTLFIAAIEVLAPSLHAQAFELPCPAGYTPLGQDATSVDPQTGLLRAFLCRNQTTGIVVFNDQISSANNIMGFGVVFCDSFKFAAGADIAMGCIIPASNAMPPTGGKILIPPNPSGECYTQTTQVAFQTIGKYISLEGWGPGSTGAGNAVSGPVCINYVPITATSAYRFDYAPANSQGGFFEPTAGMRNLTLINNSCITSGGCGSSAEGITIAALNGGAENNEFTGLRISGFGKGVHTIDSAGFSWGMVFRDDSIVGNTIGYQQDHPEEATTFTETRIANNGIGLNIQCDGDITFVGGSLDSNTVAGIATGTFTPVLSFSDAHFEVLNGIAANFLTGSASHFISHGGVILNDNDKGSIAQWFSGGTFDIYGTHLACGGQTTSNFVFKANNNADIHVQIDTPSCLSPFEVAFEGTQTDLSVKPNNATGIDYIGNRFKIRDSGQCLMSSGSCTTQNLASTYVAAPLCFANWTGTGVLTGILKVPSTTKSVTPASSVSTDTAQVNWWCTGN